MVQGSYPRYQDHVDEEKERLMKADEEAAFIEVTEVSSQDGEEEPEPPRQRCRWMRCRRKNQDGTKKKRPLWRRFLRFFLTLGLFWFLWISITPFFAGFFSCRRHIHRHGGPMHDKTGLTPNDVPKLHYDFNPSLKSFAVEQETNHVPTRVKVLGSVRVYPADKDHVTVDFKIAASDKRLLDSIDISPKRDGIAFTMDPFSITEQTVNVTTYVYVPKDKIKKFYVSTHELNVHFADGVDNDFELTRVSTVSGDVSVRGTHKSDCVKVRTVSGDVKGRFDLVHGVGVKTVSGKIKIAVNPVDMGEKKAYLGTDSVSGDHHVYVVNKMHKRNLKSWHRSTSGDIYAQLPETWQGKLKLKTTSGKFKLVGKHLKIEKGEDDKKWKAVKGEGMSRTKISTLSGNVHAVVGEDED